MPLAEDMGMGLFMGKGDIESGWDKVACPVGRMEAGLGWHSGGESV